ncbi:heme biosynthesis HemY N-terminal domain-containing protein [Marinobacter lutaoensis]|uniref:heme biosynthesis HemY N-terminal domain-containing protein n=1 Tax=Marinobacter lutaoensis TaxID=135739 RepID=UPI000C09D651|nr:heme biosynthesis HemY N-terminal domain-containing protein [Marinobacter lutaoensis]MBE02165.1 heme biosynthesis protein HemY [Marinobacter sp.]MBI44114.1 heme biosynthesis protein HemY [Oceanospirillales bacterium]NVD36660.1 heme biosynthesis protein HemY [Marinobacter lutaoensis]|tara:strand:+ start:613 stop:1854 length:1242 start_codon:yes stop_codon:yes gene_type:complete
MIRLLLTVLVALLLGTALALGLQYDLGYIRVSYGHYLVETNAWIGLALFLTLVVASVFVLDLLRRFRRRSGDLIGWLARGSERRARHRTTKGLLALAEGNWPRARKLLTSAAERADTPLINYLAAAQAAFEAGDHDAVDELLRKAYESTPGSDLAVGITQAQLQLAGNRLEEALATLLRLRKQSPHHPFVLKLLKNTYLKLEDWKALAKLLPDLEKRNVMSDGEFHALQREVWHNLLEQAAQDCERRRREDPQASLEPLTRLWDELPGFLRRDEHTIRDYARLLAKLGDEPQAETLLRKVLRNHWSDELINLYGRIRGQKPDEQLLLAEQWLKDRPNNAELLLALGRLSLRNELWGKAKEYFETSLRLRRSREALAELSRLNAHMGEEEASIQLMMQGLAQDNGLPELPMPRA